MIKQHNESNVRPVRILAIAAICASILLGATGLSATNQIELSGTSGSAVDQTTTRGDAQLTEGTVESAGASTSAVNMATSRGDARFAEGTEGLR
jgi:hypothetical protein